MNTISKIIVLLIFIFTGTAGLVYAGGPECGDGIVQEPEQCDDGNLINGDGCNMFCQNEFCGDGIVQAPEQCDDGNLISGDGCSNLCTPDFGDEGCKPRFWSRSQNFVLWPAPFTPDTLFSSVFEDAFPGQSLLQVLNNEGFGLNALGRHAVAALLNAASSDVAYDRTLQHVITMFNGVYTGEKHDPKYRALRKVFKALNTMGCPLRVDENND